VCPLCHREVFKDNGPSSASDNDHDQNAEDDFNANDGINLVDDFFEDLL
jgi:hypothetical protein